jgi:hypothetical protein
MARARPCRASIFAMIASKLTINARMPESVRVRLHLRWLGSRPGRVPVNTPKRFNHESVPPADSTLPLDAAARVVGQGPPPVALAHRKAPRHGRGRRPGLTALPPPRRPRTLLEPSPKGSGHRPHRSRSPVARLGAIAGVADLGGRRFRRRAPLEPSSNRSRTVPGGSGHRPYRARSPRARLDAIAGVADLGGRRFRRQAPLEPTSNRPRIVLEPSLKVPASFPEGSRQGPYRARSPRARLRAIAGVAGLV